MERGLIDVATVPGPVDLQSTVESGQSYLWNRDDGVAYDDGEGYGETVWYWTTVQTGGDDAVIRARQTDAGIEWESTTDAVPHLRRLLRLDDDLPAIRASAPDDGVVRDAYDAYWGMRIVEDPPFGSLISFICSTQMRVARIHGMQRALRSEYGSNIEMDGRTYRTYPRPAALAAATEQELRDLGLGYRAPYVQQTAAMVADDVADPTDAREMAYTDARDFLTTFVGVGEKVADCVLLFSLGFLQAVPLDTWIRRTITEYYPDCDRGNYADTSAAIREALGGQYAGYTQTYLFHYLRNGNGTGEV